jgi:hypothetical protein
MSGSVLSTVAKAMSGEKSCALWPKTSVMALRMIVADDQGDAETGKHHRERVGFRADAPEDEPVDNDGGSAGDRHGQKRGQRQRGRERRWFERDRQCRCERRQDPVEYQRGIGADGQQLRIGEVGEAQHVHDHRQADRTQRYDGAGQDAVQQVLDHGLPDREPLARS